MPTNKKEIRGLQNLGGDILVHEDDLAKANALNKRNGTLRKQLSGWVQGVLKKTNSRNNDDNNGDDGDSNNGIKDDETKSQATSSDRRQHRQRQSLTEPTTTVTQNSDNNSSALKGGLTRRSSAPCPNRNFAQLYHSATTKQQQPVKHQQSVQRASTTRSSLLPPLVDIRDVDNDKAERHTTQQQPSEVDGDSGSKKETQTKNGRRKSITIVVEGEGEDDTTGMAEPVAPKKKKKDKIKRDSRTNSENNNVGELSISSIINLQDVDKVVAVVDPGTDHHDSNNTIIIMEPDVQDDANIEPLSPNRATKEKKQNKKHKSHKSVEYTKDHEQQQQHESSNNLENSEQDNEVSLVASPKSKKKKRRKIRKEVVDVDHEQQHDSINSAFFDLIDDSVRSEHEEEAWTSVQMSPFTASFSRIAATDTSATLDNDDNHEQQHNVINGAFSDLLDDSVRSEHEGEAWTSEQRSPFTARFSKIPTDTSTALDNNDHEHQHNSSGGTKKKKSKNRNKAIHSNLEHSGSARTKSDAIAVNIESTPTNNEEEKQGMKQRRKSNRKSCVRDSSSPPPLQQLAATGVSSSLSNLLDEVVATRSSWMDASETSIASATSGSLTQRLVQQWERMLARLIHLTDALELIASADAATASAHQDNPNSPDNDNGKVKDARKALYSIAIDIAPSLNTMWRDQLKVTFKYYWNEDPEDSEYQDLLNRCGMVLKVLAIQIKDHFFVKGQSPTEFETNATTKLWFVTLFELLRREAWAITLYSTSTVENNENASSAYVPSTMLRQGWNMGEESKEWHGIHNQSLDVRTFRTACLDFLMATQRTSGNTEPVICLKAMQLLFLYCEAGPHPGTSSG